MIKAVLLDMDGTIIAEKSYVHKIEDFEFLPGVTRALGDLFNRGFNLFVVTNKSGIALGLYSVQDVHNLSNYMVSELRKEGVVIEEVYYCPHHPFVSACSCRKPKPGMLELAIRENSIDVRKSYMVGDRETDVEAGKSVGLRTVILGNPSNLADICCSDMLEASKRILEEKL